MLPHPQVPAHSPAHTVRAVCQRADSPPGHLRSYLQNSAPKGETHATGSFYCIRLVQLFHCSSSCVPMFKSKNPAPKGETHANGGCYCIRQIQLFPWSSSCVSSCVSMFKLQNSKVLCCCSNHPENSTAVQSWLVIAQLVNMGTQKAGQKACKAQTTCGLSVLIHMKPPSQSCHTERLTYSAFTGQPSIILGFFSSN